MTALWIAVGLLGALLLALTAGAFLLLAMGRLHLDIGIGRSFHELGPTTVQISAPRELVCEIITAPYLGRSTVPGIEVLARSATGADLVVARHQTKVHFYTAQTTEVIDLKAPEHIGFRHLSGPVPHAVEEFTLAESDTGTELRYSGQLGIDFFLLGRLAGRHWVRPQWERTVAAHIEDVRERAEQRAVRLAARKPRHADDEQLAT